MHQLKAVPMDLFALDACWPELQRRARRLHVKLDIIVQPDGSPLFSVQRWGWWRDFANVHDLISFLERLETGHPPPKDPHP